jgi:YD repeat-containing protein
MLDAAGHKKGKWKYWYASGNKKSEEDWDNACTSAKGRPFITNLSVWDDSGRLITKGNETATQQFTYFPNGNPSEIKSLVYLNRDACAKGPVEVYKEGIFSDEVPVGPDYNKSVMVERMSFYETGDTMRIDRFNEQNKRHGYQVGWYSDGKKQYEYHYNNGSVQGSVKEWYPTGQIMLDHKYSSNGGAPSLQEGIYYTDKAKDYPYSAADGKKKKVMEDIDAMSYFTKFWQENK